MGVAVCGSLLNNSLYNRLPAALGSQFSEQLMSDIVSNPSVIHSLNPELQHAVINVYVQSLQIIFRSWIFYAGMAFLASLGIKQYELRNTIDKITVLEEEEENKYGKDVEKNEKKEIL